MQMHGLVTLYLYDRNDEVTLSKRQRLSGVSGALDERLIPYHYLVPGRGAGLMTIWVCTSSITSRASSAAAAKSAA